jgi:DNA replication and repair protein RecF
MWLKELTVFNFKNYEEESLSFLPGVNALTGDNGAGKTNLLDAIHYLSLCKSYFNPIDSQQIKKGLDWFMVQGAFDKKDIEESISCSVKKNQKKQFKRNKKEYPRLADHIGLFPLVMISPNDSIIITEGSEERRKFIDNVISQTDNQYLDELIAYNKHLQNRNSFLKQQALYRTFDPQLLEVLNEQLIRSGKVIFEQRRLFMNAFVPLFNELYAYLTESLEPVELVYESQLESSSFESLIEQSLERDRSLERTTMGTHRDDLQFSVNGMPLKKFGSQGQQKSFLIALKLAQYRYLQNKKGFKPMLLLDDIFDKLDDKRTKKLMQMVSQDNFGQLFITHTNSDKIKSIFNEIGCALRVFEVNRGKIINIETSNEPK